MKKYIEYSAEIYGIYLRYISKEDIHVYSVDEAFLDVTNYLKLYQMTPKELGIKILQDIENELGLIATCGIGTNLYLAKIALDITAKHSPDFIGILDEDSYKKLLWQHKPLTDFWRVGKGIAKRLADIGVFTMEDIAKTPEDKLYNMFGVDAELLIDHAWGIETTTMADIKSYKPKKNSFSSGQVLMRDYSKKECEIIVKEMADALCLELLEVNAFASSVSLHIGYSSRYEIEGSKGSKNFGTDTHSSKLVISTVEKLYNEIVKDYPIRRVTITLNNVVYDAYVQYDFFTDLNEQEKEDKMQHAVLDIKKKFGKNSILRGINFEEGATMRDRNVQIGGHKSGE